MSENEDDDRREQETDEVIQVSLGFLGAMEASGKTFAFVATTCIHMLAMTLFTVKDRSGALDTAHVMLDEMLSDLIATEMRTNGTLN